MSQDPAFGRVFCYNNSREKKKFRPMKTLAKIVLGILAYNYTKVDYRRKDSTHVGYRTNMEASKIPNNGGL